MKPNRLPTQPWLPAHPSSPLLSHSSVHPWHAWQERLVTSGLWAVALGVIGTFAWILGDLLYHGGPHLSLDFVLQQPLQAGRAGGISTVLVGTFSIVGVAIGSALPVSVGTAILPAEVRSAETAIGRLVRRSLDVLAGIPSIVSLGCLAWRLSGSSLAGRSSLAV